MAGNLLDLGLRLDLQAALRGLRDARSVTLSVLWAFVVCPALASVLALAIPLAPPYAAGLILLGLAPCAPLLPMMSDKTRGDLNYTPSFMLLASAVTVVFLPLAVPLMVKGLTVSACGIAKPMLALVLLPLLIGVVIHSWSAYNASSLQPFVKTGTGVDTVLMLILVIIAYGRGFLDGVGTYAIRTQIVLFSVVTAGSRALSFGLPLGHWSAWPSRSARAIAALRWRLYSSSRTLIKAHTSWPRSGSPRWWFSPWSQRVCVLPGPADSSAAERAETCPKSRGPGNGSS